MALALRDRRKFLAKRAAITFGVAGAIVGLLALLSGSWLAETIISAAIALVFILIPIVFLVAPFAATRLADARVRLAHRRLGPAHARADLRHIPSDIRTLVDDARALVATVDDRLATGHEIERLLWDWLHRIEASPQRTLAWLEHAGAQIVPLRAALDRAASSHNVEPERAAIRLALNQWVERCESPQQPGYR